MSYVLDLEEEEASFLMLQVLANERKGQANAKEIKKLIEDKKLRPWSNHDKRLNASRSNVPMWHQIIQNAVDRFNTDRHFYRASSAPARCALTLDHFQSCARLTNPARTGFRLT